MVAWEATFLGTQQALVKFKQHHIDLINVIPLMGDEILNDDVELIAPGQSIASPAYEISGFLQIQLQCDGKCHSCCLGGLVLRIVPDLGE